MSGKGREFKTRCIVLKKVSYGESSLIIEALSLEFGKISIMAKGVRKEKSHWLGVLDILNELDLILYKNPESQWYIFISALLKDAHLLDQPLAVSSVMQAAAELYKQIEISTSDYEIMYELLRRFLVYVKSVGKNHIALFWRFLLRFFNLYGIDLNIINCSICKRDTPFVGFYPLKNGFICDNCLLPEVINYTIPLSGEAADIIKKLPQIGNYLDNLKISSNAIISVNRVFLLHLSEHFHQNIKLLSLELYPE